MTSAVLTARTERRYRNHHHALWRRGGRLYINILPRNSVPQDKQYHSKALDGSSPGRTGKWREMT